MKRSISFHRTMYLTTLQVKYIAGNNLKKVRCTQSKKDNTYSYYPTFFKLVTYTGFEPMNACVKGM